MPNQDDCCKKQLDEKVERDCLGNVVVDPVLQAACNEDEPARHLAEPQKSQGDGACHETACQGNLSVVEERRHNKYIEQNDNEADGGARRAYRALEDHSRHGQDRLDECKPPLVFHGQQARLRVDERGIGDVAEQVEDECDHVRPLRISSAASRGILRETDFARINFRSRRAFNPAQISCGRGCLGA